VMAHFNTPGKAEPRPFEAADVLEAVDALLAKPESQGTAVALIALTGRTDRLRAVAALTTSKETPIAVRKAATAALGRLPTDEAVAGLLALLDSAELQVDAVMALGTLAEGKSKVTKKALESLQKIVGDEKSKLRDVAATALASSRPG